MINKPKEKERAISLRRQGFSYSEILKQVHVSKSTLSLWLRSVGLSKEQKQKLTEKKLAAMKRGWEKVHQNRLDRVKLIKEKASSEVRTISKREKWLMGIALYWAEGSKEHEYSKSTNAKFSNSDPLMLKLFKNWLIDFCSVPPDKLSYELTIHEKADWKGARKFWSQVLGIDVKRFRVYFKRHNPKPKRNNTGKYYHGQIRIIVLGSVSLTRKISGWIDGVCKNCGII